MTASVRADSPRPDADVVRQALTCGRQGCRCGSPGGNVHCPGPKHSRGDQRPSLSVTRGDRQAVVLDCKGGCSFEEIVAELQTRSIWPRPADVVRFTGASRSERETGPSARLVSTTVDEIKGLDGTVEALHVRQDFDDGDKNCFWQLPGRVNGLKGRKVTSLPLYGMELLSALPDGATVVLCEGEKATKAARSLGLAAIGTVTGASVVPDDAVLKALVRFDVVEWPDHDDKGRTHMRGIAERLVALNGHVRLLVWGEHDKDDAADFVDRGRSAEEAGELVARALAVNPKAERVATLPIISAVDLAAKRFTPRKTIVPNLLVEGATMVVAPGKSGKSRLMMGIAVAVAHGGVALGSIDVEGGDVLYLALEDGERRGQARMLAACGGGRPPTRLHFGFTWNTMDKGGLDEIESWLSATPDARLVIVDTLKRFRAATDGRRNAYDVDYEALAPLNDLALRYGVCIVIVHHTNKIKLSDDPTDRASGSTGMLAAVDGMIVMERTRGKADAILHVFHRDMEDAKYAVKADEHVGWHFLGDAEEHTMTDLQGSIVDLLLDTNVPLKPADVAAVLGRDRKDIGTSMWKMSRPDANGRQVLVSRGGSYWPASRPWPTLSDEDDEPGYPSHTPSNRGEEERERGGVVAPVGLWDGGIEQPEQPGGTAATVETGATGGESHSLEVTEWKECEQGAVLPVAPVAGCFPREAPARMVTPPSGSNLPRAREAPWRCLKCRAFEHRTLPDGSERCAGCGHISRGPP